MFDNGGSQLRSRFELGIELLPLLVVFVFLDGFVDVVLAPLLFHIMVSVFQLGDIRGVTEALLRVAVPGIRFGLSVLIRFFDLGTADFCGGLFVIDLLFLELLLQFSVDFLGLALLVPSLDLLDAG